MTKTHKGRTIPMLSKVREIFAELYAEAEIANPIEKVFAGPGSTPYSLTVGYGKLCPRLGWTDLTLHSLRHTFSTRLNLCGVSPFAQKDILGHRTLAMTGRYTHLSDEDLKISFTALESGAPASG